MLEIIVQHLLRGFFRMVARFGQALVGTYEKAESGSQQHPCVLHDGIRPDFCAQVADVAAKSLASIPVFIGLGLAFYLWICAGLSEAPVQATYPVYADSQLIPQCVRRIRGPCPAQHLSIDSIEIKGIYKHPACAGGITGMTMQQRDRAPGPVHDRHPF
jgi:hypothetical protein